MTYQAQNLSAYHLVVREIIISATPMEITLGLRLRGSVEKASYFSVEVLLSHRVPKHSCPLLI